jgi:hypothetical protein
MVNTILREREWDCDGLASMNDVEASDAIKAFLAEQDAICAFAVAWPYYRKLEKEMKNMGFAEIICTRVEPHCVYVIRGRIETAACRSVLDLQHTIKKLARSLGFKFRSADAALSISRNRFRAVLHLPHDTEAIAPD